MENFSLNRCKFRFCRHDEDLFYTLVNRGLIQEQHLGLCSCQSRDFDAQIASITITFILYNFLTYYRRINDYETLGGLFELIKDDICEKTIAQKLWQLFDELLQVIIETISESGSVTIIDFKKSPEYQYLKGLFEESFLSTQILGVG